MDREPNVDIAYEEADVYRENLKNPDVSMNWFVNLPRTKRLALIDAITNTDDL